MAYSRSPSNDEDFFPAACDFLALIAGQMVHLELKAPESRYHQGKLGFHDKCWRTFKTSRGTRMPFPRLENLSMSLLPGRNTFAAYYSRLIPRGVTTLALSGRTIAQKFTKYPRISSRFTRSLGYTCLATQPSPDLHLHWSGRNS